MPMIKIKNADFYYELHGKGQPIVLVTGYGGDHSFWTPVLPFLTKDFQVLVFDNRAIGQTKDHETFPLTVEIMADDVIALIKELNLQKPHIVGQSMGGTVVQNIAARYPDQINKLAVVTSSPKWRQAMLTGFHSILEIQRQNCAFETLFETILAWVHGETFLQDSKKVAFLRSMFLNNPYPPSLADQKRQYAVLKGFDGRAALSKIKAPTLVIYGTEDITALPSESQAIAAGIPHAELVALECGHGITAEVPEELGKLLLKFLKD